MARDPDNTPPASISTQIADPRVLSRDELRSLDRLAVDELGLPSILLMENAAIGAAWSISRMFGKSEPGSAVVIAGTGNNGGDGLAVARQLDILGHTVCVLLVGEQHRLTPDSASNLAALRACRRAGFEMLTAADEQEVFERLLERLKSLPAAIIIDALLGTGLNRAAQGPALGAIRAVNEFRRSSPSARVVALDLPSGLDADTGKPLGDAVRADATMTFAALKTGFFTLEAQDYVGEIELLPIGVPPEITGRFGNPFEHEAAASSRFDSPGTSGDVGPGGVGRDANGRR